MADRLDFVLLLGGDNRRIVLATTHPLQALPDNTELAAQDLQRKASQLAAGADAEQGELALQLRPDAAELTSYNFV